MVHFSHPYVTTGKTIALTIWTFVGKVMSLLFNAQSRFFIAFLPRSKCLNFMATVTIHSDFLAQENKICQSYRSKEALPAYCDASVWFLSGILYLFKFVVYSVFNPVFTAFCTLTKAAKPGVSEQGSGARLRDCKPRPAHTSCIILSKLCSLLCPRFLICKWGITVPAS